MENAIKNVIESKLTEYDKMMSWNQREIKNERVKLEEAYKLLTEKKWKRKYEDRGKWVGCCYETEVWSFAND